MVFSQNLDLDAATQNAVASRLPLVFDSSVWITLADGKTREARDVRGALEELCAKELIFCPLSFPIFVELRKQRGASLKRTALLMEQLSLNVSFRELDQIYHHEIAHFLEYLRGRGFSPLEPNELFGPILSCIARGFYIGEVPGISAEESAAFQRHLGAVASNTSLEFLVERMRDEPVVEPEDGSSFQAQNQRRRELAGASIAKARRIEAEYMAQRVVIPLLNSKRAKLSIQEQLQVTERVKQLPRSRRYGSALEHILHFLPAVRAYIEVMTVSGLDVNRKDRDNDFYDRCVMTYGLAYGHTFAAIDTWVESLMQICNREHHLGAMAYVGDLASLGKRLGQV